jgi:hypothetical protein
VAPDAAPATWWNWLNGNVTREGITADLEAMARVGVGGAQIFNAAEGIPHGPVDFNSPEWLALVKHAAKESRRLGLELCIHNCAGWSSSGGPWNTPQNGMKVVVTSERQVSGPSRFDDALPQPPSKLDFYRDIAVLAFRTPAGERVRMRDAKPAVTLSEPRQDGAKAVDGNPGPPSSWACPSRKPRLHPARLRAALHCAHADPDPRPRHAGCSGRVEASDDGQTFRPVETFSVGRGNEVRTFAFKPVTAKNFRVLFTGASAKTKRIAVAEVDLSAKLGVENLAGKIFLDRGGDLRGDGAADADADAVVRGDQIVNLTAKLGPDGRLAWDVPAGEWTVLRLGYTANGRSNHPAPKEGTGLECDKLSKEAAQAHWDGHMAKIIADLGKYAGNAASGLNNVLIDSYEVGCQNWTAGFEKEFKRRRGYDLTPYLPALTGRVVDSPEKTERFLWDFRRVIADLFAENYAGQFAEMAHRAGLQFSSSLTATARPPTCSTAATGTSDERVLAGQRLEPRQRQVAASVAHVYGKKVVGAERSPPPPRPAMAQRPVLDQGAGRRRLHRRRQPHINHRYAHQPGPSDALPRHDDGTVGHALRADVTWWSRARTGWRTRRAVSTCCEGRFVADVCLQRRGRADGLRGGGLPAG